MYTGEYAYIDIYVYFIGLYINRYTYMYKYIFIYICVYGQRLEVYSSEER